MSIQNRPQYSTTTTEHAHTVPVVGVEKEGRVLIGPWGYLPRVSKLSGANEQDCGNHTWLTSSLLKVTTTHRHTQLHQIYFPRPADHNKWIWKPFNVEANHLNKTPSALLIVSAYICQMFIHFVCCWCRENETLRKFPTKQSKFKFHLVNKFREH